MLRLRSLPFFALVFAIAFFAQTAFAQDYSMQEMMEFAKPGDEHKMLADYVGDWEVDMGFNMTMQPGGQMSTVKGSSTVRSILGGRFFEFTNKVAFMGQETTSIQVIGFDRRFEKYVFFGIDEMGTYYITAEGGYDETTGEISMTGVDTWPTKDGGTKGQNYTMVYQLPKDGKYSFKILFESEGGEMFEMVAGKATKK